MLAKRKEEYLAIMAKALEESRPVFIRGEKKIPETLCPPGHDYCWECGHIAPYEEFLKNDRCPNPNCPFPGNWND